MWKGTLSLPLHLWVNQDGGRNSAPTPSTVHILWATGLKKREPGERESSGESGENVGEAGTELQGHCRGHIFRKKHFQLVAYQFHEFYLDDFKT